MYSSVDEIDKFGILQATFSAMAEGVSALSHLLLQRQGLKVSMVLVDGNLLPTLDVDCKAVVRGDSRSLTIAAASILAKQARDQIMHELATIFPNYGWQTNAGYSNKKPPDCTATIWGYIPSPQKLWADKKMLKTNIP